MGENTSLTRDNTTSFQSDDVENVGKINNDLMIETGVTNKNKIEN